MNIYDKYFHIIPYGKSTMSKHRIGTRFDTLGHKEVNICHFICTSLNFSKIFSFITKVFINIHEYANELIFI